MSISSFQNCCFSLLFTWLCCLQCDNTSNIYPVPCYMVIIEQLSVHERVPHQRFTIYVGQWTIIIPTCIIGGKIKHNKTQLRVLFYIDWIVEVFVTMWYKGEILKQTDNKIYKIYHCRYIINKQLCSFFVHLRAFKVWLYVNYRTSLWGKMTSTKVQ